MTWLYRYVDGLGVALDIMLCAILGGPKGTTISMWAELDREKKERWACVVCRWLNWIQPDHCADQVKGVAMTTAQSARALAGLLLLAFILFEIGKAIALLILILWRIS